MRSPCWTGVETGHCARRPPRQERSADRCRRRRRTRPPWRSCAGRPRMELVARRCVSAGAFWVNVLAASSCERPSRQRRRQGHKDGTQTRHAGASAAERVVARLCGACRRPEVADRDREHRARRRSRDRDRRVGQSQRAIGPVGVRPEVVGDLESAVNRRARRGRAWPPPLPVPELGAGVATAGPARPIVTINAATRAASFLIIETPPEAARVPGCRNRLSVLR